MNRNDVIRNRDQKRLRSMYSLVGEGVHSRENRVLFQYLQAWDIRDLLIQSAEINAGFASAGLLRSGLDTLATGFWIACIAPEEYLRGEGNLHIPPDITLVVPTLPPRARDMLQEVIERGFVNDLSQTLLKDVLNPATHGDALVSLMRMGSASAQGWNWAQHLSDIMIGLTHNFVILIRELAGIDVEAVLRKHVPTDQDDPAAS